MFNVFFSYDHMIPHGELHSRIHTISSFTYRASKLNSFALMLFTALTLISVAVAAFSYVGNNDRKKPLKGEDFRR